jgi:MHS family shikimate/dehydroshikimate transporter-like MFS transporter
VSKAAGDMRAIVAASAVDIFGLNYAVINMALPLPLVLGAIALGAAVELITIPLCGALSDRIGRRPVYMLGCIAAIALAFPASEED